MNIRSMLIFMGVIFSSFRMAAQEWKSMGSDELFKVARDSAFEGHRETAREMLYHILESSPDYEDVRILLARTFAWDGRYDEAREELKTVLEKSPKYRDAYNALIDTEMWDDEYQTALKVVNKGLNYYPNFEDFLYKKARILRELGQADEASRTLSRLLTVNPSHENGLELREQMETNDQRYKAGISYGYDHFSDFFDPAHYLSIQVSRQNNWGSAIARANYSNRFDDSGIQGEVDLYPKIVQGVYAYLNYGYSPSELFPKHRIGAEIHSKLLAGFEGSVGTRYLDFGGETQIFMFTGSLGYYFGNYWISVRPFITPDNQTGMSVSNTLTLRRYFKTADDYIGLIAGIGFSPDQIIQSSNGLSTDAIYVLKRQGAGLTFQTGLGNWLLNGRVEFNRQELAFDIENYVIITTAVLGVDYRF